MTRSVLRVHVIGQVVLLLALAACGGSSGTGDAGQTAGSGGGGSGGTTGVGGTTGAGGTTGSAGSGGGACAACAATSAESCPVDVATAQMCPSVGRTCCAGDVQWMCGQCAAETCRWFKYGPATTGTAGAGGRGGGGGVGGGGGSGGGGGTTAAGCGCNVTTQYCSVTVGGAVGNPPSYQCLALPAACSSDPTCACLLGKVGCGNICSQGDGGVTVTCEAP
jgi:hypothetical protein